MSNAKYLVVKKSDLEVLKGHFQQNPNYLAAFKIIEAQELPDAEVIRWQDIASPQMFHHYSGVILTLIELAKIYDLPLDIPNLQAISDHFHDAAVGAEEADHKIPD